MISFYFPFIRSFIFNDYEYLCSSTNATQYRMKKDIPKFDLPVDYIILNDVSGEVLNQYGLFPCKIKAGLFILCTRGTAEATINLSRHTVKANDFVTLTPGSFIQIHSASSDIKLYVAGFSSKFISDFNSMKVARNLYPVILGNPVISLSPDNTPILENIYKAFIGAYPLYQAMGNKEIAKAILSLLTQAVCDIYQLHRSSETVPTSKENNIYKKFMLAVMQKYSSEHNVSYYAQHLGLSLPYFCNCIKKASGRTPLDIITTALVTDAKAQLSTTELSVKEIAHSLGFENAAYFTQFFKRLTGSTPQEYRKH